AALALCAACTLPMSRSEDGGREQGYAVTVYEPFDNSRDWGPSYLVGPPLRQPDRYQGIIKSDIRMSFAATCESRGECREGARVEHASAEFADRIAQ